MNATAIATEDRQDDFVSTIARATTMSKKMILPFADFSDMMTDIFRLTNEGESTILVGGHCTPDIEISADRADLKVSEHLGQSPFASDPDGLIAAVTTGRETIYVANPSRVSGANYGLADLEMIARAIPDGLLVIDEYYFDFYGITGKSLIKNYPNIVVVRSFTSAFGISSAGCGFAIASSDTVARLKAEKTRPPMSATLYRILNTTLESSDAKLLRLKLINDEALRVAGTLTRAGIQCRISPTDFLLLRVADPVRTGNYLAKVKISVDNLHGYPAMQNYLRYTLQSELSNQNLLNAFRRMPRENYALDTLDKRLNRLRAGSQVRPPAPPVTEPVIERETVDINLSRTPVTVD